jgi:uncharacterized protein
MTSRHWISPTIVVRLATGRGSPSATRQLTAARLSRALLLAAGIARSRPDLLPGVDLFTEVQRVSPADAAAVLTYPWVSTWMSSARDGDPEHLNAIAVAAAIRAGVPSHGVKLRPDERGRILLPSLGVLQTAQSTPVSISVADLQGPVWQPIRRARLSTPGYLFDVSIDDLDPHRDCHGRLVSGRLDDHQWHQWHQLTGAAFRILAEYAPEHAADLAMGLTSITPLATESGTPGLSATHSSAYGGFAATAQTSTTGFATTMVHEFAHSKLHALHELIDLNDTESGQLYFAPWRADARPLHGLLQGTYAFMAVAEVWRLLGRKNAGDAIVQFAVLRAQLRGAIADLSVADGLTSAGRTIVSGLADELQDMNDTSVDADIERRADDHLTELKSLWLKRNGAASLSQPA